jgi:nucleotide-binding universal stress UspA family protein
MPGHFTETASSAPAAERRPVLVPVDFSSCSAAALLFGAHLAGCAQAPLLVLHVVHEPRNEPGFYRRRNHPGTALSRPLEDVARDMLADFMMELRRHESAREVLASARTRLVNGLPAQRILEVALQEDAALIVIGSRGRSGLSRLAAASVAGEVAEHSPVPVTVVKAPGPQHRQPDLEVIGSGEWWTRRTPARAVQKGAAGKAPGA